MIHLFLALILLGFEIFCLFGIIIIIIILLPLIFNFSEVPFVPAKKRALEHVIKALELGPESVLYDLGSGDGRLLLAAYKSQPQALYKGIEKNAFPLLLSRLRWFFAGKPDRLKFTQGNIFTKDIKDASHIYTYLSETYLGKLFEKFANELKPGTKIVSLQFKAPLRQPESTVSFSPGLLGEKVTTIYIYRL
jgi:SAM-dependent methyltransferase